MPDDAALLADLAERIFLDTFAAQNKPEDVALHISRMYGPDIQLEEINDPSFTYLIAEVDGKAAGFAMIGDVRSEAFRAHEAPVELFRFYVDKEWHGRGIAIPMMDACEKEAIDRGGRTICLSVWKHNPRAIRFYEKIGFQIAGDHPYILGEDVQSDWVMIRPIGRAHK